MIVYVLASFVSTWHSWSYHRKRSFSWGNASIRSNCKAFFSISYQGEKAPCGWDHLWAGNLGSIREQAEQARGSKPVENIPTWSSCFLTCLSSSPDFLGDEQQYGSVSQINPYLPNLLLGHDVCAWIETLTKTGCNIIRNISRTWQYRKKG